MALNSLVELSASSAKTATDTYDLDEENLFFSGIIVIVVCTAKTSSPSVVFTIQGYDETANAWYDILSSAAVTNTGTTRLHIGPGVSAVANVSTGHVLPRRWRVKATHGNTDSITYSVGGELTRAA